MEKLKLIAGKKARYTPFRNKKGELQKGYSVRTDVNKLYYRETFRKEGIPDFFRCTGFSPAQFGAAKTWVGIEIQRHRNKALGIDDEAELGKVRVRAFGKVVGWARENYTPKFRKTTQAKHEIFWKEFENAFSYVDVDADWIALFNTFLKDRRNEKNARGGLRHDFTDHAKYLNVLLKLAHVKMREGGKPYAKYLQRVDAPEWTRQKGRIYTRAEVKALYAEMNETMKDQLVLCYECLMRKREALHLEWDRVNLETGEVRLDPEHVKTGEGRRVFLSPLALRRMQARWKRHVKRWGKENPYVFASGKMHGTKPVWDNKSAWKSAKERAGITGRATWHSFRNTAYTILVEAGHDLEKVGRYGGTKPKTINDVYLVLGADHTREISGRVRIEGEE